MQQTLYVYCEPETFRKKVMMSTYNFNTEILENGISIAIMSSTENELLPDTPEYSITVKLFPPSLVKSYGQ